MKKQDKNMGNFPNCGSIPKLRFLGFNGKWEERYISEVISSKSKKYNPENSDSNYPSIELESLSQDSGELLSTFDSKNQKSIKNVFNTGDVLFGKLRPYLKKYYLADFDGVCSSEIWVLKSSILDSNYLYAFVQSNSFISLTQISSGSKMPRADWNLVSCSSIVYPSNLDERNKIGEIIKLINSRIQTQKKIIEQLETLMNASREKIFSQKLRFKDEKGNYFPDWKLHKMSDLGMFFSGGTPLTSNRKYYQGNIPFIKSGEINSAKTEQFISEEALKNSSAKMVNVNDILYALYGATSGEVGMSKLNGAINQAILCIRTELDNLFLLNYLKLKKENILNTYLQGGQGNLSSEIIKSLLVPVPDLKEQTKIANFLSSIQEKIETEKQILEKLEFQKKFLLANLFV